MDGRIPVSDKECIVEEISEEQGIAWITLNRPERKNALSRKLLRELADSLKALAANDRIRCIVTTGAGNAYSSGLDLYDLRTAWQGRRRLHEGGSAREIVTLLRQCPQVTVAAVNGWALGGGLVLVNGHDLAIAADTARFGMPEIIRGSYGATATPTLFRSGIPFKKAFYIQLTGENITGAEAERLGLVSRTVPEKDLIPFVRDFAATIASRHPVTLEHAKIAAYTAMDLDNHRGLLVDEIISHRMRVYTNPLNDVEGYLQSQKGGGNAAYEKPDAKKP